MHFVHEMRKAKPGSQQHIPFHWANANDTLKVVWCGSMPLNPFLHILSYHLDIKPTFDKLNAVCSLVQKLMPLRSDWLNTPDLARQVCVEHGEMDIIIRKCCGTLRPGLRSTGLNN